MRSQGEKQPPPGWEKSAALPNNALGGRGYTHVIVIKTPLSAPSSRWTPEHVTGAVHAMTGAPPALVINLCNTNRLYDARDFRCPVRWLRQRGGGALPSERDVERFLGVCDSFFMTPMRLTGPLVVHCTHGQNRSGYLVVQLLMRRFNFTPHDALTAFAAARPPGIEREAYRAAITPQPMLV